MHERTQQQRRTTKRATGEKRNRKIAYCCVRFEESVKERKFVRSPRGDETEWFMPEWLHIYYCPFCGTLVKGRGTGNFDKSEGKRQTGD